MEQNRQDKRTVKGVGCSVHNCRYNDTSCKSCTAQHITVQNTAAVQKGETFCDTFTPRSGI